MLLGDESSIQRVEALIGERLAGLRVGLGITQAELAVRAGIGKRTLERLEAGEGCQFSSVLAVLRELDLLDALEAVLPKSVPTPMEQLRTARSTDGQRTRRKRVRRRASIESPSRPAPAPFVWGDQQ
jgi:transcriptional regulator with XRE-family HTH domain